MGNIWAIGKREFGSFFNSPIAYIAITVFLVAMGLIFFFKEGFFDAGQATMRPFFEWAPIVFIFLLPAISMRLVSEEKRSGSLELLITMPIRDIELILGKLLGSVLFLVLALALTLVYPLVISMLGPVDKGAIAGGYLGLFLLGTAYLGVGLMTSCWTKNQIIAFVLALIICAIFYFIDSMIGAFSERMRDVFAYLSFGAHFENVAKGVLDTRDVIFYTSVTALSVTIGTYSLESRRWI